MKPLMPLYDQITDLEKIFASYKEFKKGKGQRRDVARFEYHLETNLISLQKDLLGQTYHHSGYSNFYISDPKQRHIHKATVKDRIVHHILFSVLNPLFEAGFIFDSYSCRKNKGTHKGIERLAKFLKQVSKNNRRPCWALKCDIKKFFQSVDHDILLAIIQRKVKDHKTLWLIKEIIESFPKGIPIGNLTSQLFANVYLNELDQFIKQTLHCRHYLRYTDDFVIIDSNQEHIEKVLSSIANFLEHDLKLSLHPNKVIIRSYHQGIDFLGYIQFPTYRRLRTKTKRRLLKRSQAGFSEASLQSYLGVLSHCNGAKLSKKIKNEFWFRKK